MPTARATVIRAEPFGVRRGGPGVAAGGAQRRATPGRPRPPTPCAASTRAIRAQRAASGRPLPARGLAGPGAGPEAGLRGGRQRGLRPLHRGLGTAARAHEGQALDGGARAALRSAGGCPRAGRGGRGARAPGATGPRRRAPARGRPAGARGPRGAARGVGRRDTRRPAGRAGVRPRSGGRRGCRSAARRSGRRRRQRRSPGRWTGWNLPFAGCAWGPEREPVTVSTHGRVRRSSSWTAVDWRWKRAKGTSMV